MEEDGLRMCTGRRSERSGASSSSTSSSSSISDGIVMVKYVYVVLPRRASSRVKVHSTFVKKIGSIDAPARSRPIYQLDGI